MPGGQRTPRRYHCLSSTGGVGICAQRTSLILEAGLILYNCLPCGGHPIEINMQDEVSIVLMQICVFTHNLFQNCCTNDIRCQVSFCYHLALLLYCALHAIYPLAPKLRFHSSYLAELLPSTDGGTLLTASSRSAIVICLICQHQSTCSRACQAYLREHCSSQR